MRRLSICRAKGREKNTFWCEASFFVFNYYSMPVPVPSYFSCGHLARHSPPGGDVPGSRSDGQSRLPLLRLCSELCRQLLLFLETVHDAGGEIGVIIPKNDRLFIINTYARKHHAFQVTVHGASNQCM